jgi:hypothetical protein
MDVTFKVRNVFMVILEEEKIFELVTVSANVVSDLMVHEAMCITIIVVQLIQNTVEQAVTIRFHT